MNQIDTSALHSKRLSLVQDMREAEEQLEQARALVGHGEKLYENAGAKRVAGGRVGVSETREVTYNQLQQAREMLSKAMDTVSRLRTSLIEVDAELNKLCNAQAFLNVFDGDDV